MTAMTRWDEFDDLSGGQEGMLRLVEPEVEAAEAAPERVQLHVVRAEAPTS